MSKACAAIVVVGCSSYQAGSFADYGGTFPGTHETIGCVDLGVDVSRTPAYDGPVVTYGFGNRCHHMVTLDLASVHATGRDVNGRERELHAHDPKGEIRALPLDALVNGREQIMYVANREDVPLVSLCVDIGGVDGSAPPTEQWVCRGLERGR